MNFKTTYVLFGTLLAVLLIFGLTQWLGLKKPGTGTEYVLPSFNEDKKPVNPNDIDSIEIAHLRPEEKTFLFVRKSEGWAMEKPYQLRADSAQVNSLVRAVMTARKEKGDVTKSLSQYELDRPHIVVTLKKGTDKEWKVNVGTQSPGPVSQAVVYVTSSERPDEPMPVRRSDVEGLYKKAEDFRSKELLEASAFNTTYVSLQLPGKAEPVILEKDSSAQWRFAKPAYGAADFEGAPDTGPALPPGREKPITGVRDLLETIGQVKAQNNNDLGPPDPSESDLAKFGLEQGKLAFLSIEIKRRPGSLIGGDENKEPIQETLLVGNKVESKDDKKAGDAGEKRYARLASEKDVVYVDANKVEAIHKIAENPSEVRNRDLVKVDSRSVDAIDIKNASGLLKFRGAPTNWKLWTGEAKPRKADDKSVNDLVGELGRKRLIASFPDPAKEAEYGFDKPTAVVSLWVNGIEADKKDEKKDDEKKDEKKDEKAGEKKEEKKDTEAEPKLKDPAKPTVKLTFGKEDKETVYVKREVGDEKTVVAVPKSVLTKVDQGPLAYLDRELPTFDAGANITELVLTRGGETYDVVKEGDDWKFKQPKDLEGRKADRNTVQDMINQLRQLKAVRLVAEGAADLDKYGLKAPQIQATVKIKPKEGEKPDEWAYLFGKETEDKGGVDAKQNKRDVVFVADNAVLATLRRELQDLTVFQFDMNKVKSVKMVGWKQKAGQNLTRVMERTGPRAWIMKEPPDFSLDSNQLEIFVAGLAGLRAERYVVRTGGPKPEHKLGPQDPTFRIEITVEGEKEPLILTVGALDAQDKAYYAESSTLKGAVFLLPQDRFEKVLDDPTYFSKKS